MTDGLAAGPATRPTQGLRDVPSRECMVLAASCAHPLPAHDFLASVMGYLGGLTAGAVCVALGAVLIVVLLPSRTSGPQQPAGHGAGGRSTPVGS
jgi:hypothetical protein